MKPPLILYWARRDLRMNDNPALLAALALSRQEQIPFVPLFILEDYMVEANPSHQFGYPSRWFLAQALPKFAANFSNFTLVRGKGAAYLTELAKKYTLQIFVNDDVYVDFYTQIAKLEAAQIPVVVCEDALSVAKDTSSKEGRLYSVFSPFKKSVWTQFIDRKPETNATLDGVELAKTESFPDQLSVSTESIWSVVSKARTFTAGDQVIDLDTLLPAPNLSGWYSCESEAMQFFKDYLQSGDLDTYNTNRDSLELDAVSRGKTSKMSLALAWGLVSARMILAEIQKHFAEKFDNPFSTRVSAGALTYISELIWREFYRYQLYHHPELMQTEFQERFRGTIAWVGGAEAKQRLVAWITGETGYPVVDAAMKQLAETGWMHNRSRMIVASILSKNLGIDWRYGQEYFRAALIDLDEASNNGGWQWGASVGADPKPIRIFNPELQAKNYDSSGAYRDRWLYRGAILATPKAPLIEHVIAREEALVRYGLKSVEPRDY